jgi:2-polyprenyl-3-methyl-5-hydroxy-6-metoxy-1,4-benzoquinol methylase
MISEEQFLKNEIEWGLSKANPDFVALCNATAQSVKDINVISVLDYGCGTGVYSKAFQDAGFEVVSYDYFKSHREYCKEHQPSLKIIEKPITTDLMLFIEVAEHMTDKELNALFKLIQPNYILFSSTSATTEIDEDWGHINIKQQDDWVKYFSGIGYQLQRNQELPTQWTKLFKRL